MVPQLSDPISYDWFNFMLSFSSHHCPGVLHFNSRGKKEIVVASGYGETNLKNGCKDGVDCSDNEHQINRRTEILINKMN